VKGQEYSEFVTQGFVKLHQKHREYLLCPNFTGAAPLLFVIRNAQNQTIDSFDGVD
jgi:hypothetical protein